MATTSLSRTPGSTGDPKTFTFSTWLKVSKIQEQMFFTCGVYLSTSLMQFYLNANGTLTLSQEDSSGSGQSNLTTTQVFRDSSAFYHICVAVDTTQAVSSNRVKLYVNGTQVTDFTTETYPSLNLDFACNTSSVINMIGNRSGGSFQYEGSMSNIALVDGTALAPTSFGEVDSTSGIWKFTPPSGITWGTNGFWLKGENSAALGTDSSGNTNTFAVASGTPTQSISTPSNVYATGEPLINLRTPTYSNGNNTATYSSSWRPAASTHGMTKGKWYMEAKVVSGAEWFAGGITDQEAILQQTLEHAGHQPLSVGYYGNGNKFIGNASTSYGSSYTSGDVIGCALDIDNGYVYFSKNNTWQDSGDPTSGASGTGGIALPTSSSSTGTWLFSPSVYDGPLDFNYGTGYFGTTAISSAGTSSTGDDSVWEYDCPANYYGLSTKNLNTYG